MRKALTRSSTRERAIRAIAMLRYNTDGTPDASFGTGGVVILDFARDDPAPAERRLQPVPHHDGHVRCARADPAAVTRRDRAPRRPTVGYSRPAWPREV